MYNAHRPTELKLKSFTLQCSRMNTEVKAFALHYSMLWKIKCIDASLEPENNVKENIGV